MSQTTKPRPGGIRQTVAVLDDASIAFGGIGAQAVDVAFRLPVVEAVLLARQPSS